MSAADIALVVNVLQWHAKSVGSNLIAPGRGGRGGQLRGPQDANSPPPPLGASGQQLDAKGAAMGAEGARRSMGTKAA